MSKHTPGPWIWHRNSQYRLVVETEYEWEYKAEVWNGERNGYQGTRPAKNRLSLAVVDYASQKAFTVQKAEAVANANLIASAPELLEALIFARKMMIANDLLPSNMPNTFEKIDEVIAKAKGEAND
jgi:hypothetical protein